MQTRIRCNGGEMIGEQIGKGLPDLDGPPNVKILEPKIITPLSLQDPSETSLRFQWSKRLLRLNDRVHLEHAHAARVLGELVRIHQFDKLIALIQEALKEKANG